MTRHTLDLPNGNRTSDREINEISEQEERVVVTKDEDFVSSFLVAKRPFKLLLISTGNISNTELEALLLPVVSRLDELFADHSFVELSRTSLIVHG